MASDKIQQTVERFVDEMRRLVAEEARDALFAALSGEAPLRRTSRSAKPARGGAAAPAASRGKTGRRVRRSAEDLEAIQGKILTVLKKQPGVNSEELQDALGMEKADVQRPLALLREDGKVKTEGQKRAMRYYVKGRG